MKRLLVLIILLYLSLSVASRAGNLSEADGIVVSRVIAYVYMDIARSVCRREAEDIKTRLETALSTSGLTAMRESDICVDDARAQRAMKR